MSTISLTKDAINLMSQEAEQEFMVQIINLKKMKTTSRITCDLSDGICKIKAYITDPKITESNLFFYFLDENNAFILIKDYGRLSQEEKTMGIVVQAC